MLKKSNHKLIILKILLFTFIVSISIVFMAKFVDLYKTIHALSTNKLPRWLQYQFEGGYVYTIDKITTKRNKFYLEIDLYNVSINSKKSQLLEFKAEHITGRINLITVIFSGSVAIENILIQNVNTTTNYLYKSQRTKIIMGKVTINSTSEYWKKKTYVNGEFNLPNLNFMIELELEHAKKNLNATKLSISCYASDPRKVITLLPGNVTYPKLLEWLDNSILEGLITTSNFVWDLKEDLLLEINFKEVTLKYSDNYPLIQNLNANVKISNDNLEITMLNNKYNLAKILNHPINQLSAKIHNITSTEISPLYIYAQAKSSAKEMINFLEKSSFREKLPPKIKDLSLQGQVDLGVSLAIPLVTTTTKPLPWLHYTGILKLRKSNLQLLNTSINDISADFKFGNNYILTEKFQAKIFEIPVQINFKLDQDKLELKSNLINFSIKLTDDFKKKLFYPNDFKVELQELAILGEKFSHFKIISDLDKTNVYFSGEKVNGKINYKKNVPNKNSIILNKMKINLDNSASMPHQYKFLLNFLSNWKFECTKLYLNENFLGKVAFTFPSLNNNDSLQKIEFSDLFIENQNFFSNIIATIGLDDRSNYAKISLDGRLNTTNFGSILRELNIDANVITNGTGDIKFNCDYTFNPDTAQNSAGLNLTSKLYLKIKSGFILGIDPGVSRILGLFNLENIPRRLNLDFSDLTNKGFSFDLLQGNLELNQANLKISNILIKGPAADISLNGNFALTSKQLDLIAVISYKIGATLPLAAAMAAGNPIIGTVIWLFDYAAGAKFSKIKMQKYKINGTWDNPTITALE